MKKYVLITTGLVGLLGGCASVTTGSNQSLSVETRSVSGAFMTGANCRLENPKGVWFVTTPGSVTVQRAYDDLSILCTKQGTQPGLATVKSSTKAMAFGNILLGGIIGAGVDVATGAAYDYPSLITVQMGSRITVGAPAPQAAPASATPDTSAK
jgi:hypothetical protein